MTPNVAEATGKYTVKFMLEAENCLDRMDKRIEYLDELLAGNLRQREILASYITQARAELGV